MERLTSEDIYQDVIDTVGEGQFNIRILKQWSQLNKGINVISAMATSKIGESLITHTASRWLGLT